MVVSSPPHDQMSILSSGSCVIAFSNDDVPLLPSTVVPLIGIVISFIFAVGLHAIDAGDWSGCWVTSTLGFSFGMDMVSAFGVNRDVVLIWTGFSLMGKLDIPYWTKGENFPLWPIDICGIAGRVPNGFVRGCGVVAIVFYWVGSPKVLLCPKPGVDMPSNPPDLRDWSLLFFLGEYSHDQSFGCAFVHASIRLTRSLNCCKILACFSHKGESWN